MLLYAHLADNELIRRKVKMGQADCYEVLMRRHNRTLYRIGKMYGLDDQTTEALMHAAHLEAYDRILTFDPAGPYRNWISRIMAEGCRRYLQQTERPDTAEDTEGDEAEETVVTEPQVAYRSSTLQKSIEQLPFTLQAPLILCEIEGFSTKEAAALLQLETEVVAARLQRGKMKLRGRLLKWYYNADVFSCQADCNDRVVAAVMRQLA